MRPPLYKKVHDLALDIVNASAEADEGRESEAFAALKGLCESNDGGDLDHPLQWEALGDFSESHADAMAAYEKGLQCAARLRLPEYKASIRFAMAESLHGEGDIAEARRLAREARTDAKGSVDDELKGAIKLFLAEIDKT